MSSPSGPQRPVRHELGLKARQKFAVIAKGLVIELVPLLSAAEARGLLKSADSSGYRDRTDGY